ncbi:MAG: ribonuclease R [Tenericutes bacterium]|nr:ribonuclease R [Mycoplasmatota bacterium]MDD6942238.1 ribonuclease R [bacterium]MDY2697636.1 ribonuclease R [Bacilli bacterium]MDY5993208.1 ribonuclease R [Bacilli bacterium]
MRDDILNILKNSDRALDIYELQDMLHINDVNQAKEFSDELRKLEDEVIVYHSNKDKYMMLEKSHLRKGVMRTNKKGFGFVEIENMDDDVYVAADNMNGAIHDDIVLVEITSKMTLDRLEGRVLKIIKRQVQRYIGEITFDEKGKGHIKLDDNKIKLNIEIPKDKALNAVDGHKVVVELVKKLNNNLKYEGKVLEIIGHKNDPGVDILSIIYKYNINTVFPDEVKEEVSNINMEVLPEELKGRRDLRDQVIFTIDGDDTKDIDDAISIEKFASGHYKLGVHIADVSYYVKEGSPLDNEAMERGTSVYLVDRVIPMLPHELSNGICSLNPNVDRLAISCVMEFDSSGKQIDYEIFPSVIRSRIQMTYKKVNSILEKNVVPEGYEPYADTLRIMAELASILRKVKVKRGYINFDIDEAKILVDENCKPTEITVRERGTGENLIEDFMIAANECVATHIYFMNLPFIYRVHEVPKEEKIRSFLGFVSNLGYQVPGDIKDTKPTTMQRILKALEDKPEYKILSSLLLRCMQKAVYRPENLGHYGLASSCYTHFTSPIRRYPDTTVHRLLRTYLFENKLDNSTIRKWEEKLVYIAEHSSERERASVDCEREVEDMKMAEYMESHIGEEFEGMISSVTSFGMFVELDNLVEGLVPLRDMPDFFVYDEERMTLTGEKSHVKYSIGERVLVKVVRASKEDKTIDFEIVKKV